jgi:D-alanine--poly(phosphoribitol) ligase subunit 1
MLSAVKFVRENELRMWFSVPSVIAMLQRTKTLKPGSMPSLRRSFFAGEPLPGAAAEAWLEAAANSTLDNLYGPTEATVVCLSQEVTKPLRLTAQRGIVALGHAFGGVDVAIVDDERRFVGRGVKGEIALSGAQLAVGYLNLPDLTAARFPIIDGRRWYLTGDYGYQDDDGISHHLGRIDNQVKLEETGWSLRRSMSICAAWAGR